MHGLQLEPTDHRLPSKINLSQLPQYLVSVLTLALLVFANLLGVVESSPKLGKGFRQENNIFTFWGEKGDGGGV